MDAEDWPYALMYAIKYRGLEHPKILVSGGHSGINTQWTQMDNLYLGGVKSCTQIFLLCQALCLNPQVVQSSTVLFLLIMITFMEFCDYSHIFF